MADEYTGRFPDHPLRGIISDDDIQASIDLAEKSKYDAVDLSPKE